MDLHDHRLLQPVVIFAAAGGLVFVALVGWVLAFDISSIATMIAGATDRDLLSALFIGGALTKGVTIGAAFGFAYAAHSRRALREVRAMTAAPATR